RHPSSPRPRKPSFPSTRLCNRICSSPAPLTASRRSPGPRTAELTEQDEFQERALPCRRFSYRLSQADKEKDTRVSLLPSRVSVLPVFLSVDPAARKAASSISVRTLTS